MTLTLSPDQAAAMAAIITWADDPSRQEFRLGGLAGTGKTSIMQVLAETIGHRFTIGYAAPTGKAANVLTSKGMPATTLHSLLYTPRGAVIHIEDCNGVGCLCPSPVAWDLAEDRAPDILIVDEASMVQTGLAEDVRALGCKILWVGDFGQLKPVGETRSAVMAENLLDTALTQIHRQAEGNPIIALAHQVRTKGLAGLTAGDRVEGAAVTIVSRPLKSVKIAPGADKLVLTWTNRTRVKHNKAMRAMLGLPADKLVVGDRIIFLRNDRSAGVSNGETAVVAEILSENDLVYRVTATMPSGKVFRGELVKAAFNQEKTVNDDYATVADYAYAITTHKSQGSSAKHVVVIAEGARDMGACDPSWLYTAVSRAEETLTIVLPLKP